MNEKGVAALLSPSSVAVIGASRKPGKVGHTIVANLLDGGYAGKVVPVNPRAERILGLKSFPALTAAGEAVDLCVVAVPAPSVADAVRDAIRAEVRSLAVVTTGFRESGEEGSRLEEELTRICRSHGVPLLGPNCLGIINTGIALNASFAGPMPDRGGVSLVSQSGALCAALLDRAAEAGIGLAKVVSIGNKADLTEVDFLKALGRDDETKVIVAYLEDIRSGDDFVAAAEEASSRKPVIIMKSGTTAAGRLAASSHTGVLAGAEIAYGAAFNRAGVVRADEFDSILEYATAFAVQPLPAGRRISILSNAGGPGIVAADAVEKAGFEVVSQAKGEGGSPVHVLGDGDAGRYGEAAGAAEADEGVDAVLVVLTPPAMKEPAETVRSVAASLKGTKPVIAVFMGDGSLPGGAGHLVAGTLPVYRSPERAVDSLKAMHLYSSWRSRPRRVVTRFRVNRRRVERILTRSFKVGRRRLGEVRSKIILRAYGFRTPEGFLTKTAVDAMETADRIGYPVAMKVVSPDIVHKSDIGGVRLSVTNRQAVEDAFDLIKLRVAQRAPGASLEGVYVEKMLPPGVEVIIGMSRDPQFGPMLMFGLGGIFVEVMKDVAFHLAPVTFDEALLMLTATRSYEILKGARGQKGIDMGTLALGIQRISQLATDFPGIEEIDINPFIVGEEGEEPFVADARITLSAGAGPG